MEMHGNCWKCSPNSAFPFELSHHLSSKEKKDNSEFISTDQASSKINVVSELVFDLDNFCPNLSQEKFLPISISSQDLEYLSTLSEKPEKNLRLLIQQLWKHYYHFLPNLAITEELRQRISNINEGHSLLFTLNSYISLHQTLWTLPAVYSRGLIQEIIKSLDNQEKWSGFVVHNNNAICFLLFLLGYPKNQEQKSLELYDFPLASSLEIIWLADETVEIWKSGQKIQALKDCQGTCLLKDFKMLLEKYSQLGGNLEEYCASV
jgi:hypothetical protein